jgi:DNA-binding NtrC family response regulator
MNEPFKLQYNNDLEEFEGGNEVILLVDDDDEVRNLGQILLEEYGYTVLLAENGAEALKIYRRELNRIDLIILDLYMPQKSGRDALADILKLNPQAKVIIYSGFDKVNHIQEMLEMGAKRFIQKPFRMKQILKDIREVLDNKE